MVDYTILILYSYHIYVIHAMDHGPRAPWEGLVKDGALVPLTFTLAPGLSQPQLKR